MKNLLILFLLSAFAFAACEGGSTNADQSDEPSAEEAMEAETALYKKVMEVHDEVMPKMGDLNRVKRNLEQKAEEMPGQVDTVAVAQTVAAIEAAENGMMDWMQGISKHRPETMREAGESHEAIMEALNQELESIEKVRDDMMSSLQKGQQMLQTDAAGGTDAEQ